MIKELAWAMRQHPDRLQTLEKMVLIGLANMSSDCQIVNLNCYKLARFACVDQNELKQVLNILTDKGFIKLIEDHIESFDTTASYKLIVTY
jgi:hypothetical protein